MITKYLLDIFKLIGEINKKIKAIEAEIGKKSFQDRDIKLLKTIPGIGDFIAFLVKSEIDTISRFPSKEKLCSYAGLVPSTRASGDKSYSGRITKQGNKYLRWALTEAVKVSIRYSPYLYNYFLFKNFIRVYIHMYHIYLIDGWINYILT